MVISDSRKGLPSDWVWGILEDDHGNPWLTLGANLGVLVGLALLILEIQQNTEMMRAEMSQARANNRVESWQSRALSEDWPRLMALKRDFTSLGEWYQSLSREDYERVRLFHLGILTEMENTAYQCEEERLDQETCQSMRAQLGRIMADLPYVTFSLQRDRNSLFEVLQELGEKDPSLPLLLDDGSWLFPVEEQSWRFATNMGARSQPRVSGVRTDNDP